MEHLKRAHPYSRIAANVVYNEYIQDRWAAGIARDGCSGLMALSCPAACCTAPHARSPIGCSDALLHRRIVTLLPRPGTTCT